MDFQKFYNGKEFKAYDFLGAHLLPGGGVVFRTFALNAMKVALIGEFNNWTEAPMSDANRKGFFELTVPDAKVGQMYKYVIYSKLGRIEHCDPYGFGMELRPAFASIIRDLDEYTFTDEAWMKSRTLNYDRPLNIFEMHVGSWKRKEDDPNGWYKYDEIADDLIEYCKGLGFTHVEFMPLAEHPFDGSWGYQQTGFYAPTSRYGTATQLKKLVDKLHNAGIGASRHTLQMITMLSRSMTERSSTNIPQATSLTANGEPATLSMRGARSCRSCSLRQITGCRSIISTVCVWMRSAASFTGWAMRDAE